MHNPADRILSYRVQSITYQSIAIWHGTGIYLRDMKGKRRKSRITRGSNARTIDVVSQLECATRNPRAAALGALLGGIVPWFARALAHGELPEAWRAGDRALALGMVAVVIGCCMFSILTVYKFGLAAFGDARKAAGFVAALEGVMLVSHGTTSVVALLVLIAVNAVTNGCAIALAREATGRRTDADARRSATRARNRADRRVGTPAAASSTASERPSQAPRRPEVVWQAPRVQSDAGASVVDAVIVRERRILA